MWYNVCKADIVPRRIPVSAFAAEIRAHRSPGGVLHRADAVQCLKEKKTLYHVSEGTGISCTGAVRWRGVYVFMRMKVSDYIARKLVDEGISDVFMVTGGGGHASGRRPGP